MFLVAHRFIFNVFCLLLMECIAPSLFQSTTTTTEEPLEPLGNATSSSMPVTGQATTAQVNTVKEEGSAATDCGICVQGTCVNISGVLTCVCEANYFGDFCDQTGTTVQSSYDMDKTMFEGSKSPGKRLKTTTELTTVSEFPSFEEKADTTVLVGLLDASSDAGEAGTPDQDFFESTEFALLVIATTGTILLLLTICFFFQISKFEPDGQGRMRRVSESRRPTYVDRQMY